MPEWWHPKPVLILNASHWAQNARLDVSRNRNSEYAVGRDVLVADKAASIRTVILLGLITISESLLGRLLLDAFPIAVQRSGPVCSDATKQTMQRPQQLLPWNSGNTAGSRSHGTALQQASSLPACPDDSR